ncbi:MAG: Mov34/MPN/PAD-1 family protein [Pseudomonadota bacterium]
MIWSRPGGGRVAATSEVWEVWSAAMRDAMAGAETGGILLGRRLKDSADVVIDQALPALQEDDRGFLSFIRGEAHQRSVDRAWRDSMGVINYLGDWHTHPQRVPSPSGRDVQTWRRLASIQQEEHRPLFFFILGNEGISAWESGKSLWPMDGEIQGE